MASSKIKGINIKIGADTQGLSKALQGIEAKSKSTQSELREINNTINKTPKSLIAWKQKQDVLTKAIADSREKVKLLEDAQEQVAKQFADKKISGEQYRAFQRELENARSETKRLDGQLQETKQKIREFGNATDDTAKDTDKLGDSMENAGKDAEKSSESYTVLKGTLANLATQGINFAFDKLKIFTQQIIETGKTFEASMSNVSAISGATGDEIGALSEKAKQMGATTKYTASQAADAFGFMALAGWETTDMLAGIDGVLNLAAASNMDLALASDIVTDYLTAFGLTAQDSGHFVDMMTYAMSKSNTTTELLGEAYKNCAATAASMGYSAEETTAVLMTMANAGVKGGEAGTALNAIMTRLATDTKNCASELKEYGVHIYDTKGNMNSLSSILQGVSGVWTTLTDQQQANLAKIIAGTNHYSALQTIMNGLSDSAKESGMSFTDYSAALEECDGTAQGMSKTMIDNLAGDMTILDSSIDGVKLALSEKLNPLLRDLVQYITEKMPEIQENIEKPFDVAMTIADWCKKNMPQIKKTISDVLPIISGVAGGFVALETAKTTSKAISGLTSTIKALNLAMSANPATAVAIAIAGLATVIGMYCVQVETEVSRLQEISNEVDKQYSKEHDQIDKTRESIRKVNEKFDESAKAIDIEGERVEYLWKQLHELGGETGKVEDAERKRVEYILGELNQALGTEYELTGNQIQGYKDLQAEIDKTIAKKKAEAYLDALWADASTMAQNKADTKSAYITARKQWESKKAETEEAESTFNAINSTDMTAEEIVDYYDKHGNVSLFESEKDLERKYAQYYVNGKWRWDETKRFTKEQLEAAQAYINTKQEYVDAGSRMRETQANYNEVMAYYDTLDRAETAFAKEEYDEVENIAYNPKDNNQILLENATDFDEEIKNAYNESQKELTYELKLALNAEIVNQDEFNDLLAKMGETVILGLQKGAKPEEVITEEMDKIIQAVLDKELDISALAEWAKSSGIDIGTILGEGYKKVVQAQFNAEYDITELLEWAENSGIDVGKVFSKEYKATFEAQFAEGFGINTTGIFEWAIANGKKVGDLMGDNAQKTISQYLYRVDEETGKPVNDLIPKKINSASDAYLYTHGDWQGDGQRFYDAKFATGGYISSGNRAIVAEAGPELLEVMNGGIRVTPLRKNSGNNAAADAGTSQKIFYNTYNINNPRIANNMDIRTIAQELAMEQKRIEVERGLR